MYEQDRNKPALGRVYRKNTSRRPTLDPPSGLPCPPFIHIPLLLFSLSWLNLMCWVKLNGLSNWAESSGYHTELMVPS